ncbi:hypothetical protein DMN77_10825 [Paenibacillus sp. 79R4]|nr:hypothetical protein [Paenibacillus sp. 79R4]
MLGQLVIRWCSIFTGVVAVSCANETGTRYLAIIETKKNLTKLQIAIRSRKGVNMAFWAK